MPVNAPAEYFKAEEKFRNAKTKEQKMLALEEMIRLLPKHHGSENMHAQLRARLAKLKKKGEKKAAKKAGVAKEGEAQICLVGYTKSGKSWLLSNLTNARPEISDAPYTTKKPEIGMMDYEGVKLQVIEIPSTFEPEYVSIARSCDLIVLVSKGEDIKQLEGFIEDNFIRAKHILVNTRLEEIDSIREKIWDALGLIIVYTRSRNKSVSPMALKSNSTVREFAQRVHKDFVKNFRFARIFRKQDGRAREIQAGLGYRLKDRDVVELHMK